MLQILAAIRHKVAIGFVGGSDLSKQQEQLGTPEIPVQSLFDYCFSENGLTAYRMGVPLVSQSFIGWLGEEKYKKLVKFCLRYVADLDIPVMRGTFVEFRNGMINVSPVGRNASQDERESYQKFDLEHKIREKFVEALKKEFSEFGLTYVQPLYKGYTSMELTWATVIQSVVKYPSMFSRRAGTRRTACSMSRRMRSFLMVLSTIRSISLATRLSRVATTMRSMKTRERLGMQSIILMIL
jgi:HAD superfamily hydrolase (TIGR01484 family)